MKRQDRTDGSIDEEDRRPSIADTVNKSVAEARERATGSQFLDEKEVEVSAEDLARRAASLVPGNEEGGRASANESPGTELASDEFVPAERDEVRALVGMVQNLAEVLHHTINYTRPELLYQESGKQLQKTREELRDLNEALKL
jgi:hypothetical protein